MVRYFYAWIPFVFVGTLCLLALPWLGLIALMVVALAVVPATAVLIVYVPYTLVRAIGRSLKGTTVVRPRTAPVLAPAAPQPALEGYRAVSAFTITEGANR